MEDKSEIRNPKSEIRPPRLPIHVRRLMPRRHRRADNLWAYTQAIVERLGFWSGKVIATLHEGRVVHLWLGFGSDLADWPGRDIAARIGRLLAGSALKYGTLTVEIARGQVKWITPAPRFKSTREELDVLGRLFDR